MSVLEIDLNKFDKNVKTVKKYLEDRKVMLSPTIKVYHGDLNLVKILSDNGIKEVCSSRVSQLKKVKENFDMKTLLLRLPSYSELADIALYVDTVLISEFSTASLLNDVLIRKNKTINAVIMQDIGDLREGLMNYDDILKLALSIEKMSNVNLYGIGVNFNCYGSVRPTYENMSIVVDTKKRLEQVLGRKLDILSGGATTSLELMFNNLLDKEVNHLRVGGLLVQKTYYKEFCDFSYYLPSLEDVYVLKAEIIELNSKPTYPIGELVVDGFGNKPNYVDRGVRKRAIIALGKYDVGSSLQIYPLDKDIKVLGGSSDHIILDIEDSKNDYKVGDVISFYLDYESILFSNASVDVSKVYKTIL